jgi:hypothetical protein
MFAPLASVRAQDCSCRKREASTAKLVEFVLAEVNANKALNKNEQHLPSGE